MKREEGRKDKRERKQGGELNMIRDVREIQRREERKRCGRKNVKIYEGRKRNGGREICEGRKTERNGRGRGIT